MKLSILILLLLLSSCFLFQKKPPQENLPNSNSNVPVSSTVAQVDSSIFYSKIITADKSKKWYTRPGIIDNVHQINYTTLSFDLPSKAGSISEPAGRDIQAGFRNFSNWKVQKEGGKYVLVISSQEKYFISVIRSRGVNLILESFPTNNRRKLNLSGYFFETPLNLN
ncbi:MAG: hypothetical protein ABJB11_15095 [Ferruginibacter sp.]